MSLLTTLHTLSVASPSSSKLTTLQPFIGYNSAVLHPQLLTTCCVFTHWQRLTLIFQSVDSSHVSGVVNTRADGLSRITATIDLYNLASFLQAPPTPLSATLVDDLRKVGTSSWHLQVEANCRRLLLTCVSSPRSIVGELMALDSAAGKPSV